MTLNNKNLSSSRILHQPPEYAVRDRKALEPKSSTKPPFHLLKVLYLKNLAKQVTEEDLVSLFIRFQSNEKAKLVFKLLSGRMRGQAFITFPDVETATSALKLVNGYELK